MIEFIHINISRLHFQLKSKEFSSANDMLEKFKKWIRNKIQDI